MCSLRGFLVALCLSARRHFYACGPAQPRGLHRLTGSRRKLEVYTGYAIDLLLRRLSRGRGKAAWIADR
jgi:hypothetical protein